MWAAVWAGGRHQGPRCGRRHERQRRRWQATIVLHVACTTDEVWFWTDDARSVMLVAASARGRIAASGGARRAVGRAFLLRVGRAARRRQWLLHHGELPVHAVLQRVALNDGQDAVLLRAEFQLQRIRHHQLHWHRLRRRRPHAHHLAHDAHHLLTCLLSRRQCAAAMCCSLLVLLVAGS